MPERVLYEYAVIRIVPRTDGEEFFNAGIILFCASQKFLKVQYLLRPEMVDAFGISEFGPVLEKHLSACKEIAEGEESGGPIGKLIPAERFRWLTATRSTMIQTSKVHPGYCKDPGETLKNLFEKIIPSVIG